MTVLAADGRHGQLALTPGQQPLLGVEIADALGHAALGLCASDAPSALPLAVRSVTTGKGMQLLLLAELLLTTALGWPCVVEGQ